MEEKKYAVERALLYAFSLAVPLTCLIHVFSLKERIRELERGNPTYLEVIEMREDLEILKKTCLKTGEKSTRF